MKTKKAQKLTKAMKPMKAMKAMKVAASAAQKTSTKAVKTKKAQKLTKAMKPMKAMKAMKVAASAAQKTSTKAVKTKKARDHLRCLGVALLATQCQGAVQVCQGGGDSCGLVSTRTSPPSLAYLCDPEGIGWIAGLLLCICMMLAMIMIFAIGLGCGYFFGCRRGAEDLSNAPVMHVQTRTVQTRTVGVQSQCKYTWWALHPRFTPLPEQSHGVF